MACFKGRQVATGKEWKIWPVSKGGRLQQEYKERSGLFQRRQVATGIEWKIWPVSMEGRLQQEKKGRSGLFQRKTGSNRKRMEGLACFKGSRLRQE
jgi:hypothetical protein